MGKEEVELQSLLFLPNKSASATSAHREAGERVGVGGESH